MSRFLSACLVLVVLSTAVPVLAADPSPTSPGILPPTSPNILPPTAPFADFSQPGQSSSWLISTMHIRGPEKIIGTAVVVLLLIALVMFVGMLRHVYGGAQPRRP